MLLDLFELRFLDLEIDLMWVVRRSFVVSYVKLGC